MTDEHPPAPAEQPQAQDEAAAAHDPLQKVAGAMLMAAKAGAGDASATASNFIPAAGRAVSKTVYAGCYYLSYGVVFPTMLVVGVFPKNNPVYFGLADGGRAAKDAVHQMRERRAALKAAGQEARDGAGAFAPSAAPA